MKNEFPFHEESQRWNSNSNASGLYAIFMRSYDDMPEKWAERLHRDDGLLYIGKAKTGLCARLAKHFEANNSSKDTFRRSIGAVLRKHLSLKCQASAKKSQYYFDDEDKLSKWIQRNCQFVFQVMDSSCVSAEEKKLIQYHKPPLNIQNNPAKLAELKSARDECADIAE